MIEGQPEENQDMVELFNVDTELNKADLEINQIKEHLDQLSET